MSNLKRFETTLDGIKQNSDLYRLLDDCKTRQGPSFNASSTCYDLSGTVAYIRTDPAYTTPYVNAYVSNPYTILNGIPNIPATGGKKSITYNNILGRWVNTGYTTDIDNLTAFQQDIADLSGGLNRATDFNSNIKDKYKTINELRSELDNKMRDIYNPEDQDPYILHNQSVYMTLSWTILATSVLYYLFVKL